eukprot:3102161-Rhodomonas_salina.2
METSDDRGVTPWMCGGTLCALTCTLHASDAAPPRSVTRVPGRRKLVLREACVLLSEETYRVSSAPDKASRRLSQMWCTDALVSNILPASPEISAFPSFAPIC